MRARTKSLRDALLCLSRTVLHYKSRVNPRMPVAGVYPEAGPVLAEVGFEPTSGCPLK
jgi:hypothetical protein